jgi:hypothetical protein
MTMHYIKTMDEVAEIALQPKEAGV